MGAKIPNKSRTKVWPTGLLSVKEGRRTAEGNRLYRPRQLSLIQQLQISSIVADPSKVWGFGHKNFHGNLSGRLAVVR